MHFKNWSLVICSSFLVFSCSQKKDDGVKSFAQFASNLELTPSENCGSDCTALKKEFRYVEYVAEKIYCYWDEKQQQYGIDFKAKATEMENTITDSTTETQYYILLQKWAALFKDGHVNAMLGDDLSKIEFYGIPVRFEMLAPGTDHETLIVSQINSDSIKNLKVGTVVDKIQGKPWQSYITAAESYASGSTVFMRHRGVARSIPMALLEQEGAKPISVEGTYKGEAVSEIVPRKLSLYDGSKDEDTETTGIELINTAILANNVGYLRIDGFEGTKMAELLSQAMERLKNTDALLIDVRANGGGDQSGNAVLSLLADRQIIRYKQRAVWSDYLISQRPQIAVMDNFVSGRFSEMISSKINPGSFTYGKPVAVLTGPFCFSACDTFTSALKENKLATVLGENTGGGTGSPLVFDLPISDNHFRYSVMQGFGAVSGDYIEGKGTAPDVVIEPTVQDRVDKADGQLAKALTWISQQIAPAQSAPQIAKVVIPDSLIRVDVKPASDVPVEIEIDKEIRKSSKE